MSNQRKTQNLTKSKDEVFKSKVKDFNVKISKYLKPNSHLSMSIMNEATNLLKDENSKVDDVVKKLIKEHNLDIKTPFEGHVDQEYKCDKCDFVTTDEKEFKKHEIDHQ